MVRERIRGQCAPLLLAGVLTKRNPDFELSVPSLLARVLSNSVLLNSKENYGIASVKQDNRCCL